MVVSVGPSLGLPWCVGRLVRTREGCGVPRVRRRDARLRSTACSRAFSAVSEMQVLGWKTGRQGEKETAGESDRERGAGSEALWSVESRNLQGPGLGQLNTGGQVARLEQIPALLRRHCTVMMYDTQITSWLAT